MSYPYVWLDEFLPMFKGIGCEQVECAGLIQLGEAFVASLFKGPDPDQPYAAALLALHIRNPEDKSLIIDLNELKPNPGTTSKLSGKLISTDGGVPSFVDKYKITFDLLKEYSGVEKGWMERVKSVIVPVRRIETPELQASFYSFFGAVLMRLCANTASKVTDELETFSAEFAEIYSAGIRSPSFSKIEKSCLGTIANAIRPGSKVLHSVLYGFITAKFKTDSPNIVRILDNTLMERTKFYGMDVVIYAENAYKELGYTNRETFLNDFTNCDTDDTCDSLAIYYETYFDEKADQGKYAPWCRLFDSKYWPMLAYDPSFDLIVTFMARLTLKKDIEESGGRTDRPYLLGMTMEQWKNLL